MKEEIALPIGWEKSSIVEVADVYQGAGFPKILQGNRNGDIPFFKVSDISNAVATGNVWLSRAQNYLSKDQASKIRKTLIPEGSVVFAKIGEAVRLNRRAITKTPCLIDNNVAAIKGLNGIYDKFIYFFLKMYDLGALSRATTVPSIRKGDLQSVALPLPPYNEQRRIVAKIEELFSELDKGVESLKTARAQLNTYRQSLLKAAFEGRLTEQWRRNNADKLETADQLLQRIREEREARYQKQLEEWKADVSEWEAEGKPGKKSRKPPVEKPLPECETDELEVLPRQPKAWRYVRLATIASVGSGMSVSKSRKLGDPIEVAYLRVANVQRGRLVLDEIKTMPIEKANLKDLQLKKWDILFNEGGDRDKLGRGWVWEEQVELCITQNHVFRATTYLGEECHAKFISYWGNVFGRDYFESFGKQTTNLASINKTVLKMFPVPIPPHDEQREIVSRIEEIESQVSMLEKQIEDGLSRSESLRQSILKRALEGKLVPQDPGDEPASQLLERIRQEQANQPKSGRRKCKTSAPA